MLEKNQIFVVPTFGYRNKPEGENLEKFNEDLKKLEIFENQVKNMTDYYHGFNLETHSLKDIRGGRAILNKLINAMKEGSKQIEENWLNPVDEKILQVRKNVQKTVDYLSTIIHHEEQKSKEAKKKKIEEIFNKVNIFGDLLSFETVFDAKWLFNIVTLSDVKNCLEVIMMKIERALYEIDKDDLNEGFKEIWKVFYFETLDLENSRKKAVELRDSIGMLRKMNIK